MNRSLTLALVTIGTIALGCGSTPPDQLGTGGASASSGAGPTSGPGPTSGSGSGMSSSASGSSGATLGPSVNKDETLSGDIDMPATATVEAGVTLTLAAGAKIHAGDKATLVVKGTLIANGTAASQVVFDSKALKAPGDWTGLEIASGGNAKLTQIAIHHATVAFQADAGSMFTVDYITVDTSSTIAELDSNGTLGHGQLHGNGANQQGDTIFVSSASPTISDTLVDNSNSGTDQINVNGATSGPVFDHMEISTCHCAFHFNQGKNITISNSYVHDSAYGMMIIDATGTQVTGNNFEKNTVNIGDCSTGNVTSNGNYFENKQAFDLSCNKQPNTNTNESAMPLANLGPRP